MNIILFGPPGAGKGTQSDNIVNNYNLFKISTGDLLRKEIEDNTDLGKKIENLMNKGILVPDQILNDLIKKILLNSNYFNRLIFDGYPRNLNQAKSLDNIVKIHNQKISYVFSLNVSKDTIVKRILGRQTCSKCGNIYNDFFKPATKENHSCDSKYLSKRLDDNEKTIANRYETYLDKTLPILDFYKKQKLLHEINGEGEIDQIYKEIVGIIGPLHT